MRKRRVTKWGDSTAISIPKNDAFDLELKEGTPVDLSTLKILEKADGSKPKKQDNKKSVIRYISQWGPTLCLVIRMEDLETFGIKKGDLVDLDTLKVLKDIPEKERKKNE